MGYDPDMLASISREKSAQTTKDAIVRGLMDERAARETQWDILDSGVQNI